MKLKTTGIGSFPYTSIDKAINDVFNYFDIPFWPQLPKLNFFENMYVQFSENFPGIVVNEKEAKIYIEKEKAYNELEKFYNNYLAKNYDYFSISKEYAKGFYLTIEQLKKNLTTSFKCQLTGPITFGLAIKDETSQAIFYDTQLREVIIKHIVMKSLWQLKEIIQKNENISSIMLFLDEPYLASYGSAFTAISKEDVINTLKDVILEIKNEFKSIIQPFREVPTLLVGVHCCANTDFSLVLESPIDILSFDAYNFFDNFYIYKNEIIKFINRGGIIAWGIVPTDAESLAREDTNSLIKKFKTYIDNIGTENILENSLFTHSCGLGSLPEELTEKALTILKSFKECNQ